MQHTFSLQYSKVRLTLGKTSLNFLLCFRDMSVVIFRSLFGTTRFINAKQKFSNCNPHLLMRGSQLRPIPADEATCDMSGLSSGHIVKHVGDVFIIFKFGQKLFDISLLLFSKALCVVRNALKFGIHNLEIVFF